MSNKVAILISDIHFDLNTLEIASKALSHAIKLAEELALPLIIAGDLNNSKAIIRGEVANRLISLLENAKVEVIILVGNHDLINQKGTEHSLNFLKPYATVVSHPVDYYNWALIPYQATKEAFLEAVNSFPKDSLFIVHQGIMGAYMGDYFKDNSSVDPVDLPGRRIISGHYHRKQDITLPDGGNWSYLGSPYTTSFSEANDGPKGPSILYMDGSLEQIKTDFRKHVIIERAIGSEMDPIEGLKPDDLLWLKVAGPYLALEKLQKSEIGKHHLGHSNYKLDKVYIDSKSHNSDIEKLSNSEVLDQLIDNTGEAELHKKELKALWREVLCLT